MTVLGKFQSITRQAQVCCVFCQSGLPHGSVKPPKGNESQLVQPSEVAGVMEPLSDTLPWPGGCLPPNPGTLGWGFLTMNLGPGTLLGSGWKTNQNRQVVFALMELTFQWADRPGRRKLTCGLCVNPKELRCQMIDSLLRPHLGWGRGAGAQCPFLQVGTSSFAGVGGRCPAPWLPGEGPS